MQVTESSRKHRWSLSCSPAAHLLLCSLVPMGHESVPVCGPGVRDRSCSLTHKVIITVTPQRWREALGSGPGDANDQVSKGMGIIDKVGRRFSCLSGLGTSGPDDPDTVGLFVVNETPGPGEQLVPGNTDLSVFLDWAVQAASVERVAALHPRGQAASPVGVISPPGNSVWAAPESARIACPC